MSARRIIRSDSREEIAVLLRPVPLSQCSALGYWYIVASKEVTNQID